VSSPGPDVAVIGPGAIGCAFGAAAAQAGRSVLFGARTPFERLHVEFRGETVDQPVDVLTDPARATPAPLVLLATKTHQTGAAAAWLRGFTERGSVVASLQNGVEHRERVDPLLPGGAVSLPTVVVCAAERTAPGRARVSNQAQLFVPAGDAADQLSAAMTGSVAEVVPVDDWTTVAWTKLMTNSAIGAVGVLARRDYRMLEDGDATAVVTALMEETAAVGRAEGAELEPGLVTDLLEVVKARAGGHLSSIVADRLAGRPTEWRDRNEVIVRRAQRHGIDVPLTRLVTTLVRMGEPGEPGEPRAEDPDREVGRP
jgi:2-dehydropantoate 2-reductase